MTDILDDNLVTSEEVKLSGKDIFIKLWTSPREVFRYINRNAYTKHVNVLLVLGGITSAVDRAVEKNLGGEMSIWGTLGIAIVVGGLLGWISYYISAALMSWTGKWLGGEGNTGSLVDMSAYAIIPSILATIFIIPQILIYGSGGFQSISGYNADNMAFTAIWYGSAAGQVILSIWSLVLFVIGTSEVQKFSIWKAIANILLAGLVIIVPIAILIFMIMG